MDFHTMRKRLSKIKVIDDFDYNQKISNKLFNQYGRIDSDCESENSSSSDTESNSDNDTPNPPNPVPSPSSK